MIPPSEQAPFIEPASGYRQSRLFQGIRNTVVAALLVSCGSADNLTTAEPSVGDEAVAAAEASQSSLTPEPSQAETTTTLAFDDETTTTSESPDVNTPDITKEIEKSAGPLEITGPAVVIGQPVAERIPIVSEVEPTPVIEYVPAPAEQDKFTVARAERSFLNSVKPQTVIFGSESHQYYLKYTSPLDYMNHKLREANVPSENPLVVFTFGGGFVGGSPKSVEEISPAILGLMDEGYDVASLNYRTLEQGKVFPTAFEDAINSLEAIIAANPNRPVVLAGISAGGTLSIALGTPNLQIEGVNPQLLAKLQTIHNSGVIKGVIAASPPTSEQWRNVFKFMPGASPEYIRQALPIGYAERGLCPNNLYLVYSSGYDPETPPQSEIDPYLDSIHTHCSADTRVVVDPNPMIHGFAFWPAGKIDPLNYGNNERVTNYTSVIEFIKTSINS